MHATSLARSALPALMLAFVAGCSLQPTYQRPDAPVAGTFPSGEAYKSAKGGTTLAAGDIGWRDVISDARLQRLVELSLANNRDLRVAMLNVEQARAQARIQRAALFPQVSGHANASRTHTPAGVSASGTAFTFQSYEVGAAVSWDLDFFGRLRSLSDAAVQQ